MENLEKVYSAANRIIDQFPRSKNGESFLTLQNGRKLFLKIFIKKYGIDGRNTGYSSQDILRRLRFLECFDSLIKKGEFRFDTHKNNQNYFLVETVFFRFVLIETKNKKLELLNFYFKNTSDL